MATVAVNSLSPADAPFRFWISPIVLDPNAPQLEAQVSGMGLTGEEATLALVKVQDGVAEVVAVRRQEAGARSALRVVAPMAQAYVSPAGDPLETPDDQPVSGPLPGLYAVVGLGHADDASLEEEVLRRTRLPGPGPLPSGLLLRLLQGGSFDYKGKPPWQLNSMAPDALMPEAIDDDSSSPTRLVVVGSRPDPDDPSGSATTVAAARGNGNITATPVWVPRLTYAVLRIPVHDLKDETGTLTISWNDGSTTHYWYPSVNTVTSSGNRDVVHGGSINKKTNVSWGGDGALIIGPWQDL